MVSEDDFTTKLVPHSFKALKEQLRESTELIIITSAHGRWMESALVRLLSKSHITVAGTP
jgi:hypothetical protein